MPLRRGYRWFISNPLLVRYLGQTYQRRPYDLLRVHSLRFTGPAAFWARRRYRLPIPIIAHHHHLDRDRWTGLLDQRVAQAADLVIADSRFSQQQVERELEVARNKVVVVYPGVPDHYRPAPMDEVFRRQVNPAGGPLVLHVGSLRPRKNLSGLLEAFARICQHHPNALLVLVGRGPRERALRAQARQLGIAQAVRFAGPVNEAEKLAYYRSATLMVSASLMEGFGFAVAEAMACGRAVVATQSGSLPELIREGDTGLLAPAGDATALSQAMLRLLNDEALALRMGAAGAARVDQHFRWERAARQIRQHYERALCPAAA